MKIGFLGLGQMGHGMAANLIRAGHEVTLYNRTPGKAAGLGAPLAATPGAAAAGQEVVFTMLANDAALEAVLHGPDGVLAHLPRGAIHVSCSTISVALAEALTAAHEAAGQRFVSAPVFGRPDAAAAAKLFIAAAGAEADLARLQPLFDVLGQRSFVMSDTPARANLVKLSGNFLIASVIEALGEALALVGKGGVDQRAYLDLLTSSLFNAPVYKTYGNLLVERNFEPPGFAAPLGQKDIRLVLTAAEALNVPLPLASLVRDRFLTLLANGGEALDWSAFGALAAKDSGQ
ncbi:NAD(P)-dependent oxidoreductase [Acidocella sp. KAb 2-4]|uniref:NAD(P)-dependent oxidoreductase n=1 Tax=Acidocella sp. KAb 2-4 TaxID=2885158 RepID=UPI001D0786C4|nr:NAD(P)-dependent oxidoreductase [Acidocella sp. KAb 2-4]MCB5944427.1 NAD(P)-dependent oxidoreductase [Acidocella sp. KAb 2-4]